MRIGTTAYCAVAILQGLLIRRLARKDRLWGFSAYSLLSLAIIAVMLPLFLGWKAAQLNAETYSVLYWNFRMLQMVCLGWALADALRAKWFLLQCMPVVVGAGCAIVFHLAETSIALSINRAYGIVFSAIAAILLCRASRVQRSILAGLIVATLFPVIAESIGVIEGDNDLLRFVPTLSFLAAQILWLRAFPREFNMLTLPRKGTLSY